MKVLLLLATVFVSAAFAGPIEDRLNTVYYGAKPLVISPITYLGLPVAGRATAVCAFLGHNLLLGAEYYSVPAGTEISRVYLEDGIFAVTKDKVDGSGPMNVLKSVTCSE